MAQKCRLPLVIDIKRHSLEDGPGIRSVVFFKGCPLHCIFCQNPESRDPGREIAFYPGKCIECGECKKECNHGAIDVNFTGRIQREKCVRCGNCGQVCPAGALRVVGTYYPSGALAEVLLRDAAFYRHSGGGVTFSGGESTLYPEYLEAVCQQLKARNIHIVLETSGYFEYDLFKYKILPYMDIIYFDIKFIDPEIHSAYTGMTNEKILDNFQRLLTEKNTIVHPRIPLVPGITATGENLSAIVDFLYHSGVNSVSLLPYNPLGMEMATHLGNIRPCLPEKFMKPDEEREIIAFFHGLIENKTHPELTPILNDGFLAKGG
jgi:pyruvate formate lyase activating enzyme